MLQTHHASHRCTGRFCSLFVQAYLQDDDKHRAQLFSEIPVHDYYSLSAMPLGSFDTLTRRVLALKIASCLKTFDYYQSHATRC